MRRFRLSSSFLQATCVVLLAAVPASAQSSQMRTRFAMLNPTLTSAHGLLRFSRGDGTAVNEPVAVPARTRVTVDAETLDDPSQAEFSTIVESDVALVVDRTVRCDFGDPGSHAETSIAAPSSTLVPGGRCDALGVDLFYLLQNPSATGTATVQVRYLRPSGSPLVKTYSLPPSSRANIWVDVE
jgi:hypothetical protein